MEKDVALEALNFFFMSGSNGFRKGEYGNPNIAARRIGYEGQKERAWCD
jgi:hypothetical protein